MQCRLFCVLHHYDDKKRDRSLYAPINRLWHSAHFTDSRWSGPALYFISPIPSSSPPYPTVLLPAALLQILTFPPPSSPLSKNMKHHFTLWKRMSVVPSTIIHLDVVRAAGCYCSLPLFQRWIKESVFSPLALSLALCHPPQAQRPLCQKAYKTHGC